MTDPAVGAAQRAWASTAEVDGKGDTLNPYGTAKAAAREALAPLKELIDELSPAEGGGEMPAPETDYAKGIDYVLSRLKPLIYADAELNPEGTTP